MVTSKPSAPLSWPASHLPRTNSAQLLVNSSTQVGAAGTSPPSPLAIFVTSTKVHLKDFQMVSSCQKKPNYILEWFSQLLVEVGGQYDFFHQTGFWGGLRSVQPGAATPGSPGVPGVRGGTRWEKPASSHRSRRPDCQARRRSKCKLQPAPGIICFLPTPTLSTLSCPLCPASLIMSPRFPFFTSTRFGAHS